MDKLIKMLRLDEGERLKPYKCSEGKTTIGVGRNIEDVGISYEESEMLLINDIKRVKKELNRHMTIGPIYNSLGETRKLAIENMCFNLGIYRLSKFNKMWKALSKHDYDMASIEALDSRWAKQVKGRATRIARVIRHGEISEYFWSATK